VPHFGVYAQGSKISADSEVLRRIDLRIAITAEMSADIQPPGISETPIMLRFWLRVLFPFAGNQGISWLAECSFPIASGYDYGE